MAGGTCGTDGLAPKASCTVHVARVAADNDAVGRSGTLSVSLSGEAASATVSGSASGFVATASMTPAIGYSNVVSGISPAPAATFTVRNTGNLASGAIGATLTSGADRFAIVSNNCSSLQPNAGTCSVAVARTATANDATARTATLRVSFASGGAFETTVSGTASGFDPAISIGTGTLTVASVNAATSGACTTFAVTNVGKATGGTNIAASFSGANAANFQTCAPSSNACSGSALAVGGSCNLGVRVTSPSNGSFSATMTVAGQGVAAQTRAVSGSVSGLAAAITVAATTASPISNGVSPGACTPVSITNTGNAAFTGMPTLALTAGHTSNFNACAAASGACTSAGLAPGQSCNLGTQLTEAANGNYSATATVTTSGATAGSAQVSGTISGVACRSTTTPCQDGSYYLGVYGGKHYYAHMSYDTTKRRQTSAWESCAAGYTPISKELADAYPATVKAVANERGIGNSERLWTSTVLNNTWYYYIVHYQTNQYQDATYSENSFYGPYRVMGMKVGA